MIYGLVKLRTLLVRHLYQSIKDNYYSLLISKSLPKNTGTVIVKHANPCGVSINKNKTKSYKLALNCDPISAF